MVNCVDSIFGRFFIAEEKEVKKAVECFNIRYKAQGYISLKDYADMINSLIEDTSMFIYPRHYYGWNLSEAEDDAVSIRFSSIDDCPILVIYNRAAVKSN